MRTRRTLRTNDRKKNNRWPYIDHFFHCLSRPRGQRFAHSQQRILLHCLGLFLPRRNSERRKYAQQNKRTSCQLSRCCTPGRVRAILPPLHHATFAALTALYALARLSCPTRTSTPTNAHIIQYSTQGIAIDSPAQHQHVLHARSHHSLLCYCWGIRSFVWVMDLTELIHSNFCYFFLLLS